MREILNVSLPKEMAESIKREAKARNFSVSELMRAAIRFYQEDALSRRAKKAEKEYRKGKTVVLKSIRDLR